MNHDKHDERDEQDEMTDEQRKEEDAAHEKLDAAMALFQPFVVMCEAAGLEVVLVMGARYHNGAQMAFDVLERTDCAATSLDMLDVAADLIEDDDEDCEQCAHHAESLAKLEDTQPAPKLEAPKKSGNNLN